QIVNATTPANQFHVLRRQIKREFRKPLICFTPKKLLRFPACVSSVKDFTSGGFQEVIDDVSVKAADVKKLVLCSGKIYYEMMERKAQLGSKDVAFVRIEQLYPWPAKQIAAILSKYSNAKEICWLQEEAENMGAYTFVMKKMKDVDLTYIGRKESASPATGYAKLHNAQSEEIFAKVFGAVNPVVESKSKKKESVK
ncbi:MAG TPA: 2-oxoglutarate dehydrogenase E1 component, partial [Flavobacteriales bacterium]|nr:2-oxoglutarate dehydrogenase E1 component [Flavobacteriales bacterium]